MSGRKFSRIKNNHIWWLAGLALLLLASFQFPLGQKLSIAASPLIHVAQAPARWFSGASLWVEDSELLQSRLLELQEKTERQQVLRQELTVVRAENMQLKRLLKIAQMEGYTWVAVRVISRSQESKSQRLMLQANEAKQGDIVVSYEGLVGLVDYSGIGHAVVRTILDASIAVPVTMTDSDLVGLVRGDGEHLVVDFIPESKSPHVGDILIASGAGGVFPAGLPIAVIDKVNLVEGGVFVEVIAKPVAIWQREAWLAIASKRKEK